MVSEQQTPYVPTLYRGDCLDFLPTLYDNSIDLLLTDPPYGFFYLSRSHTLPLTRIANDRHEAVPLLRKVLRIVYTKLKENGVGLVFSNWQCYSSIEAVIKEEGFQIINVLIWKKNAWGRGDLKGNWRYIYEQAIFFRKKKTPTWLRRFLNGAQEGNVLEFSKLPTQHMRHPTEKPVPLLKHLIERTTQLGEVVLDPFAGSGSTLVASKLLGRVYLGCELEDVWHTRATQWLAATEAA